MKKKKKKKKKKRKKKKRKKKKRRKKRKRRRKKRNKPFTHIASSYKRSGKPGFSPWLFSSIFLSDTHNISLQSKQL